MALSGKPNPGEVTSRADAALPQRARRLKADLLEDQRFSLRDVNSTEGSSSLPATRLTRRHWQHPSDNTQCNAENCTRTLGVRNGITNCRKCGLLFCSDHSSDTVRLVNGSSKGSIQYSTSSQGVWSRCCPDCYSKKPDLTDNGEPGHRDRSLTFKASRLRHMDRAKLARMKTRNRFIVLANDLIQQNLDSWLPWTRPDRQWDNNHLTNCEVCHSKFGFLLRKHHCRLCGRLVCNDPFGERKSCSIMVPLGALVTRLPDLNYSALVVQNRDRLLHEDKPAFRCCVKCKDDLLSDSKRGAPLAEESEYFTCHQTLLSARDQTKTFLQKFETAVSDHEPLLAKISSRLAFQLKSFETALKDFKDKWVQAPLPEHRQAIQNSYRGHVEFFQDAMLEFKLLTDKYQTHQQSILQGAQAAVLQVEKRPRLTKRQIRELREQLMVMNEQKFLIDNMINDYTRQRKFDETKLLQENSNDLQLAIDDLENKLGEFGF